MSIRVHHLNCAPDTSIGVFHVLLCETPEGLLLVDSGLFGVRDLQRGGFQQASKRLVIREPHTALRQIEALGHSRDDVIGVIATHLDFDHIGGLRDFPNATLHTLAAESSAARTRARPMVDKARYKPGQFTGHTKVRLYSGPGEPQLGFPVAYPIDGLNGEVLIIPTRGHTIGHAAVAIRTGDEQWLIHAGDAFYSYASIAGPNEQLSRRARAEGVMWNFFEWFLAADLPAMRDNQRRLRDIHADPQSAIQIVNSHDRFLFDSAVKGRLKGAVSER